jgi:transposase-like protein
VSSFLRKVRRRKKSKTLEEIQIVERERYEKLDLDAKVALIQELIPLGLMHVAEVLNEEVESLAGGRYERKGVGARGVRYGSNPGSVRVAGQRVRIKVPRVRSGRGEIPLRSYAAFKGNHGEVDDLLLKRVLYGLSCRNYERAAESIPGAIGLSSSSVSRSFVEASAAKLREFQERDVSTEHYVALFLDGKAFAESTMVLAMGVRITGEKDFLGFVETDTENAEVLTPFLRSLLDRGLDISRGILVIIDGSKGLRAAVERAFKDRALIGRCQWHKRENVVSYLPKKEQAAMRKRLQRAYNRPTLEEAVADLKAIYLELEQRNQSAAASLAEGLEETLTLHRLGVFGILGQSLKTTNCLESVNAMVEECCAKVDCWKNSRQKHRWLATALLDIEPRLRRIKGFRNLPKLQDAIARELGLKEQLRMDEAA